MRQIGGAIIVEKTEVFNLADFTSGNKNIDNFFKGELNKPSYTLISHPNKITYDYSEVVGLSRKFYYDSITYNPSLTLEEKKSILEYIKNKLLADYDSDKENINSIVDETNEYVKKMKDFYKNQNMKDDLIEEYIIGVKIDELNKIIKRKLGKGGKKYRRKSRVQKTAKKTKKAKKTKRKRS